MNPNPSNLIQQARAKAHTLYEGKTTPHRSCGIAIAETFNVPYGPYQPLRKGGLTGEGMCGAYLAGQMILGEFFGNPEPPGDMNDTLKAAVLYYREQWNQRVDRNGCASLVCNNLTAPFADFKSPERATFCTSLAAQTAEIVAETLVKFGAEFEITPVSG